MSYLDGTRRLKADLRWTRQKISDDFLKRLTAPKSVVLLQKSSWAYRSAHQVPHHRFTLRLRQLLPNQNNSLGKNKEIEGT